MKKKYWIIIAIGIFILTLCPYKVEQKERIYMEYNAILYKIKKTNKVEQKYWNVKVLGIEVYNNIPDAIDESKIVDIDGEIKKITEYNGLTTILIQVTDPEKTNFGGEFDFTLKDDIKVLWNDKKVQSSSLREGQKVTVTSAGDVLLRSPAGLTKVTKIVILDEKSN